MSVRRRPAAVDRNGPTIEVVQVTHEASRFEDLRRTVIVRTYRFKSRAPMSGANKSTKHRSTSSGNNPLETVLPVGYIQSALPKNH